MNPQLGKTEAAEFGPHMLYWIDKKGSTMHINNFLLHPHRMLSGQVQDLGLDELGLAWVAPTSATTISVLSMTYSTHALCKGRPGCLCLPFFFFLWGVPGPTESPFANPETLEVTNGPVFLRPEASVMSCSSSSFPGLVPLHVTPLSPAPCGPTNSLIQLLIFSHFFSAWSISWARQSHWCHGPSSCPPSPLPVHWRQWWLWHILVHPGQQGKGIGQAQGRRLAQGGDLSWIWPKTSSELVPPPLTGALVLS